MMEMLNVLSQRIIWRKKILFNLDQGTVDVLYQRGRDRLRKGCEVVGLKILTRAENSRKR